MRNPNRRKVPPPKNGKMGPGKSYPFSSAPVAHLVGIVGIIDNMFTIRSNRIASQLHLWLIHL